MLLEQQSPRRQLRLLRPCTPTSALRLPVAAMQRPDEQPEEARQIEVNGHAPAAQTPEHCKAQHLLMLRMLAPRCKSAALTQRNGVTSKVRASTRAATARSPCAHPPLRLLCAVSVGWKVVRCVATPSEVLAQLRPILHPCAAICSSQQLRSWQSRHLGQPVSQMLERSAPMPVIAKCVMSRSTLPAALGRGGV